MITVREVDARVVRVATRLPFRYGIAEMTAAPHVVLEVVLVDDAGRFGRGWASEQLPPKWFTKDPTSSFSDDLQGLVGVIEHAISRARGARAATAFDLWHRLDIEQMRWAEREGVPGLLAGLGTALVERAIIDAVCRLSAIPFVGALHEGVLGFDPARLHPELNDVAWREDLPALPASSVGVRHTVGFADALTDADVTDGPRDGLPVSLAGVLDTYGVSYLKVKTAGDAAADRSRLARIFEVCAGSGIRPQLTLDGNESMRDGAELQAWMRRLLSDPAVGPSLRASLIAVEQPVHRDRALSGELSDVLAALREDGVAVIIDESDSDVAAVRRALDLGYAGGTYKGCKGVFRGLANAVLVVRRGKVGPPTLMTAEDLATLPPLTVAQDLVVAAAMGLTHIERNGHHYFGTLAPLSPDIAAQACERHPDLYRADDRVGARLRIEHGRLSFATAMDAPFGFEPALDLTRLAPLSLAAARASC